MQAPKTTALAACVARHGAAIPALTDIGRRLAILGEASTTPLLALYESAQALLERAMWSRPQAFDVLCADYEALFREQEHLIAALGEDHRHAFLIGIPVADRPGHLRACLESILQVCRRYDYGGRRDGQWQRIQVVVGEDSREPAHRHAHRELVAAYRAQGLRVHYLDFDEQYALLEALPASLRARLARLLTDQPLERFHHKGQAANRNLLYLKFRELTDRPEHTLYALLDSDQSLYVNRSTPDARETVHAPPYFHLWDRIFRQSDILLLSGKMVGDPPVSPAVMAVNFLDDVIAFFTRLSGLAPEEACRFHGGVQAPDAAYHDLAGLFGFTPPAHSFDYSCRLAGRHDHRACLTDFAQRLNRFFHGEHLTRRTWFHYGDGYEMLRPARTVYPGNYVARHAGLRYVIPFGHLRLRMSGPTAGRLIAAEIGARFATCNLPNLHQRGGGEDDFRPGVEEHAGRIDLADEFERQFFGDLMLFSAEALVRIDDVRQPFAPETVRAVVADTEAKLLALYAEKHAALRERRLALKALVFDARHWWRHAPALGEVRRFLDNLQHNFGDSARGWLAIQSAEHRARRASQIIDALVRYRAERDAWDSLFDVA
ncbi:hypothetical protein [Thiobacter aerophilum]|uniref:Uncharacterized protein n=1 Tax=Thiobacter aerophilum TaxID=3121275 RepID=A0ABV0EBQ8_9BURK